MPGNGQQYDIQMLKPKIFACAARSLNIVGVKAVESSCKEASLPYMLFVLPTPTSAMRCLRTASLMCLILKCLSSTIWASGADSTRAFHEDDGKIREALEIIAANNERRQDTQHEAAALCVKLEKKNQAALMATLFHTVLLRFKLSSSAL